MLRIKDLGKGTEKSREPGKLSEEGILASRSPGEESWPCCCHGVKVYHWQDSNNWKKTRIDQIPSSPAAFQYHNVSERSDWARRWHCGASRSVICRIQLRAKNSIWVTSLTSRCCPFTSCALLIYCIFLLFVKYTVVGTGEMSQSIKHLPQKYQDLSLDPQPPCENLDMCDAAPLQSQHRRGRTGRIPGARWSASLVKSASSRFFQVGDLVLK